MNLFLQDLGVGHHAAAPSQGTAASLPALGACMGTMPKLSAQGAVDTHSPTEGRDTPLSGWEFGSLLSRVFRAARRGKAMSHPASMSTWVANSAAHRGRVATCM